MEKREERRGILRVFGKDLKGDYTIYESLIRIKGIGHNLARATLDKVLKELGLEKDVAIGDLTDEQIKKLEDIFRNLKKHGIPSYLLNRQNDFESGEDKQLLMNDLALAVRGDVERHKNIRTWKGWRHGIGQKVRGQHTRSTGRTGMTVGVLKKAVKSQKTAAAAQAQESGAKKQ